MKKAQLSATEYMHKVKKKIPVTAWPFILGVLALIIGSSISFLWPLAAIGGFVALTYVIIWITWIVFQVARD